jgi:hypothetical protein
VGAGASRRTLHLLGVLAVDPLRPLRQALQIRMGGQVGRATFSESLFLPIHDGEGGVCEGGIADGEQTPSGLELRPVEHAHLSAGLLKYGE